MTPWLNKDAVLQLTGWSERHLLRMSANGRVESRNSSQTYRGHRLKEYALASLPDDARTKYLDGREAPAGEEQPDSVPAEASRLILPPPTQLVADGATPSPAVQMQPVRVDLTPSGEKEAMRRMAILKPLLEYLRAPNAEVQVANSKELVTRLAAEHGVSERSIWRWKTQFDKDGRFALARKARADKNRSQWAAEHRDLADLAALVYIGNAEQPAQSKRVAWEAVCERAQRMSLEAPSYETVRAFLSNPTEVSPSLRTYGRDGRRKYEAQFAPYLTRGYTEPANSIWMSDHMIHDVLVQDDIFKRDLHHMRLQLTAIFDYRARYFLAGVWSPYGSSHSIKRALLKAMTRYGLPDRFYCDNGKDYISVAKGASDRELRRHANRIFLAEAHQLETGFLKRVGVPVTFCMIYHGQSKNEERWHRTLHDRFDRSWPTYTAGETHLRPENTIAATIQHGKLLRMGRTGESSLPLASEFIAACEAWIEQWYHQQPHSGRGMDGRSPAQVFEQERGVNRQCPEPEYLAMLLPERVKRRVTKCEVQLDADLFAPAPGDQYGYIRMHELNGQQVSVAYDPLDPLFAAVLDGDGNYICRLERKQLMRFSQDQETRDQVKGLIATRNGLRKAVTTSISDLNRRVMTNGYTPLAEQHMQRLELPRAVGDSIVQRPQRPVQDSHRPAHSAEIAAQFLQSLGGTNGANG